MSTWNGIIWEQFGAAIDMLENAIRACPEDVWSDRTETPEFWYVAFHTLFFLDLYLSGTLEGFAPPAPFTLDELDPAGVLPDRVYDQALLLDYLEHCRAKCRTTLMNLTDEAAGRRCGIARLDLSFGGLLLDNMRHVQHHTAQLNLILRQRIDSAPGWVSRTGAPLVGA